MEKKLSKKEFILEGLDCANCAAKIEAGVQKIDGVTSCSVSFATKKMMVEIEEQREVAAVEESKQLIKQLEPEVEVVNAQGKTSAKNEHKKEYQKIIARIIGSALLTVIATFMISSEILALLVYIAAYLLIGGDVVLKAIRNIGKGKVFDENFLMTIATAGAFAIGEYPEAVAVMLFYQVGEFFQRLAVNRSRKSISSLLDIRPDYANLKVGEAIQTVSPEAVKIGEMIVVKPGEKIPLDGKVISGSSMVDTSALTGESVPREVEAGSDVLSGFINKNGLLSIEVMKEYSESTVAKILDLVENASSKKAPTENFITKFARYYTPVVVLIAVALAVIPPLVVPGAEFSDWLYRALIFLVISCPCALVVSIPLGFFGGIGAASKQGVLIKGSNYLEALNDVEYAVFDKTGTLTKGVFKVTDIQTAPGFSKEQLMEYAAYGESFSNHPIALSILQEYGKEVEKEKIVNYEEIAGHGIMVLLENQEEILVGNRKLLVAENISFPTVDAVGTMAYVAVNKEFAGYIIISDEVKEDSKRALQLLKELGVKKTVMLTGDSKKVGEAVGKELGVDEVYAELLPQDKVEQLERIEGKKSAKGKVMFVGDGVNDTPVLARADIGIAMGGLGSDAAIEAADIVIMTDEPSKIATAIQTARRTRKIVWQNIIFALGVKVVFLTLGAFGIATMWEAVFSDVGVTLLAVINAMRVLRVK